MLTVDRVSGSTLAIFALWVIWESRRYPLGTLWEPGPAYMPVLLSICLMAFALVVAATGGRSKRLAALGWIEWRHAVAILGACAFAAWALERLGYRLTIFLLMFFLLKFVEGKGWGLTLTFALAMAFGSFFLFYTILKVPLPLGLFGI